MIANKFSSKTERQTEEPVTLKDIGGILLGCFILAAAIQGILIPAQLLTGGVTGIAIILNYLTSLELWLWYMLLNIPIFIAGYRLVSHRFAIYSLIGTFALTAFLAWLKPFNLGIEETILAAIFGGAMGGIGTGIIFHSKGSSGGLDIIAVIIKRYWGYNIGQTFFAANLLVISLFLLLSSLELALFSAIGIFVSSRMVDLVESGLNVSRTAMIISKQHEEIVYGILHNLQRGCTYLSGTGAYSSKEEKIIMTTVGKTQLPRLKEIVFQIDSQAFLIINETIEVFGKGFKRSGREY